MSNSFPRTTFFTQFFKRNIKYEAEYDIYMIKTQLFLQQTLHYSQIYNFILNHDHKFKTIIMLKDVWISKSIKICIFIFWIFGTHGSFFVEYIGVHKKNEIIWWTFDNEKRFLKQKNHLFTCFFGVF
jgi:hypothetical protein